MDGGGRGRGSGAAAAGRFAAGALVALWLASAPGCPGDGDGDDDSALDDDDTTAAGDDDTTAPPAGIIDCDPEDLGAGDCAEVAFAPFDVSFCRPLSAPLTTTIDDDSEWQALIETQCELLGPPPEPPDWNERMLVLAITLAPGCQTHAESVWFRECADQRVYAYVHARDGDCPDPQLLGTGVLVPRSQRVTRFEACGYVF